MFSMSNLPLCLSRPASKGNEESNPLCIKVILRNDDLVNRLRQKIADVQSDNDKLKERYRNLEYKYACEVQVNNELCDICRAAGIKFRFGLGRKDRS